MDTPSLFALYVGGRAEGCNIELHDVIFAIGTDKNSLYPKILQKWFGRKEKCHVDSWLPLKVVDGFKISLSDKPVNSDYNLYFINLGAYKPGYFTEFHANMFLVAKEDKAVKERAKAKLLVGYDKVHTDDLYDVDDCIRLTEVDGYYIKLERTSEPENLDPENGYFPIPKAFLE